MGSVYKAMDTKLGRQVAIKVLLAEWAAMPMMVERFHREAKAAANFAHENIVTLLDDGEEKGVHYLVMEFVEGVDLEFYIVKKGRVAPEDARRILVQAGRALDHAYRHGVVHRDIKPSNFLLTKKDGKLLVKLADMGLARRVDQNEFRVTKDGTTVGTIDYISPEQAHDPGQADTRSDIYSLGCTFFHMLAGEAPFSKGSLPERLMAHLQSPPPDICQLNPGVPETFAYILGKMLAKNPDDRYQTPKELLKDLENPELLCRFVGADERRASLEELARAEAEQPGIEAYKVEETQAAVPTSLVAKKTKAEKRIQQQKQRNNKKNQQSEKENRARSRRSEDEESEDEDDRQDGFRLPWWVLVIAGPALILMVFIIWRIIAF